MLSHTVVATISNQSKTNHLIPWMPMGFSCVGVNNLHAQSSVNVMTNIVTTASDLIQAELLNRSESGGVEHLATLCITPDLLTVKAAPTLPADFITTIMIQLNQS